MKIFEHIPVPQNSSTSPVENLAEEVSIGFSKVEKLIDEPTVPTPNFSKVVGAFLLKEMKQHGKIKDFSESLTVGKGEQAIRLQAIPSSVSSVSYLDILTGKSEVLVEVGKTQAFTADKQYKVIGKNLHLSSNFENITILVQYRGVIPNLSTLSGFGNSINKTNGEHLVPITKVLSGISFSLEYDINLQANRSNLYRKEVQSNTYIFGLEGVEYSLIPHASVSFTNNELVVYTTEDVRNFDKAFAYITNIDVSELLTNLYLDYINHTHSPLDTTTAISHTDLVNTHVNTSKIKYKDINITNYHHPQSLNREGYNPSLKEVYENAMLGDLFLSSTITGLDQNYKTLSKNSYAILFGDPVTGSKLHYESSKNNITLASGSTVNGLNINFSLSKTGLSFNNNTKFGEDLNGTTVQGKNGFVNFRGDGAEKAHIKSDFITARETIEGLKLKTDNLQIGDFDFVKDGDNVEVKTNKPESYIKFNIIKAESIKTVKFEAEEYNFKEGYTVKINEDNYLQNKKDHFSFVTTKSVDFTSSGLGTGITLGAANGEKYKAFVASPTGSTAVENNSLFIESPVDGTVTLLQDTKATFSKNGKSYVFNQDGVADVNIKELEDWFKTNLRAGNIYGDRVHAKSTEGEVKNGLKVGTTNIFVLGESAECPEGITVLESQDAYHFTKTRVDSDTSCDSLQYQTVNTGDTQVFGFLSVGGEGSFLGGISSNGEISSTSLSVTEGIQAESVELSGALRAKEGFFSSALFSTGDIVTSSSIEAKGTLTSANVKTNNLEVVQDTNIGRGLAVGGDLRVRGKVDIESSFKTSGNIEADSIATGDITGSHLTLSNGIKTSGGNEFSGPTSIQGSLVVQGQETVQGSLEVTQDTTTKSLYVISNTTVDGRLLVSGNVDMSGESISIGKEGSNITITGSLVFNTPKTTLGGSVAILENIEVFGKSSLNDGLEVKGEIKGTSLVVESSAVVKGSLAADSANFTRKITLQDGVKASGISEFSEFKTDILTAKEANITEAYIKQSLNMGVDSVIKTSTLEVSKIVQNDPAETSSFVGSITASNEVHISSGSLILGNKNIVNTRDTSGIQITDNSIKMGNNSLINAVKIFAGKGAPRDGDIDRTGGYCFQSPTSVGTSDGDTGMFATLGSGSGTENSDLQFYIDGTKKGEFSSAPFSLPDFDNTTTVDPVRAKYLITYDMILELKKQFKEELKLSTSRSVLASYPIGTIYKNSRDSRNPSHPNLLGAGVWIPFAPGRVIVGLVSTAVGGSVSNGLTPPTGFTVTSVGAEYGNFTHSLTGEENGPHSHGTMTYTQHRWVGASGLQGGDVMLDPGLKQSEKSGTGTPHNNVQPSIVAATWERIA